MPRARAWSRTSAACSRGMVSHVRHEPRANSETSRLESPSCLRSSAISGGPRGRGAVAQKRQHVAREQLQVVRLIVAREVEDELVEAEVEVCADLFGDLARIVGDDEAGARAVAVLVGQALHLHRILDPGLLLA